MARGLKICINEEKGLYYPCRENKSADQLRGYREADLRLCFRICKKLVFSRRGSFISTEAGSLFGQSSVHLYIISGKVSSCPIWHVETAQV